MSSEFRSILHNFIVPVALGFILTLFKIMSELKDLENNEWSGIASTSSWSASVPSPAPDQIEWYYAFIQLALGIGAFVWTIKAF